MNPPAPVTNTRCLGFFVCEERLFDSVAGIAAGEPYNRAANRVQGNMEFAQAFERYLRALCRSANVTPCAFPPLITTPHEPVS